MRRRAPAWLVKMSTPGGERDQMEGLGCNVCTIRCFVLAVSDQMEGLGCNVCTIRCVVLAVSWVIRSLFIVLFTQRDQVEGLGCNVCTIRCVVLAVSWRDRMEG
ncbi:hypothetical protein RRG08_048913 [Elysia crispata]|uniref:Uncharacterized protein n=1 Tax=Elysia crispata TaxID=231223 RepID=A0AAE1DSR8_9GAST|nr:hypothetical protein RRG08_048913 [Elysia crispata]